MPWVTGSLVAVCLLIQIYVSFIAADGDAFLVRYGYSTDSTLGIQLVSYAFLHLGWYHLVGNMLFLVLAGSALEDRWGHVKFLVFYLLGAVAGGLAFSTMHHGGASLLIGASGAVAAEMGAFLVCFTHTKIKMFYWFFRTTGTFEMAAYLVLPLWLGEQLLLATLDDGGAGGVAYQAHLGGFAFGAVLALVIKLVRPEAETLDLQLEPAPLPRASATELPRLRPSVPRVDRDPFRAPPQSAPIVVAAPPIAAEAPLVHDPNAAGPKFLA